MTGTSQEYLDYQMETQRTEALSDNIIGQKFPDKFGLSYCEKHDRHYKFLCVDCEPDGAQTTEDLMDDDENFDLIKEMKKQ